MKKILEKMASFMVGSIFAVLTWDAAMLSAVTDGGVRVISWMVFIFGLCLTLYWIMVPREVDRRLTLRKKKSRQTCGNTLSGIIGKFSIEV